MIYLRTKFYVWWSFEALHGGHIAILQYLKTEDFSKLLLPDIISGPYIKRT
jgi:hypothetical protein